MSKRLSNFVPNLRMALHPKLLKTSFSLPKNMRKKKHLQVERRDERAIQVCNDSKTSKKLFSADLDTDDVTSDEETDFLDEFEDSSTYEESSSKEVELSTDFEDVSSNEECSIEVARSTAYSKSDGFIPVASSTPKSNPRINVMNHDGIKEFRIFSEQERIVKEPMISLLSPEMKIQDVFSVDSYFDENSPVMCSTPKLNRRAKVMNHDVYSNFDENSLVMCSTPKLNRRGIDKFKICMDFSEQESTIKEEPMFSYMMSPERKRREVTFVYSNFDENSLVMCSTPKLNRRGKVMDHDGIDKFKLFTNFNEQESTIKEEPMFLYLMSPERKSLEVISDVEDYLQETSISSILIPDISVILKSKDVTNLPNENCPPSAQEIDLEATGKRHAFLETKASNVLEKEPIYKCNSDSEIEKIKLSRRHKEGLKNISVCCLNIPPPSKELKKSKPIVKTSNIGAKGCFPVMNSIILENGCQDLSQFKPTAFRTRSSIKDRLKKKRSNVSICCLGALECVLPTLNMAVPSVSVKNALKVVNKKTSAPV